MQVGLQALRERRIGRRDALEDQCAALAVRGRASAVWALGGAGEARVQAAAAQAMAALRGMLR